MNALPLMWMLLATQQPVDLTLSIKPKQVLSGAVEIRVDVSETKGLVQKVEFFLNGEFKESLSGYPYIFKLSTIDLDDGPAKFSFEVQTTLGEKGKKAIDVEIDNGVAKGPAFHVARALEFLSVAKFTEAELAGRIAVRAANKLQDSGTGFDEKRDLNPARIVLARAYLGLNRYDKAQNYAEDALAANPGDEATIQLLSGIRLKQAFRTVSRDGNSMASIKVVQDALLASIRSQKDLLQTRLEKMGPVTKDNLFEFVNLALKAGNFSRAIAALQSEVQQQPDRIDLLNKLTYAQIRAGRFAEARSTLKLAKRYKKGNAYTFALQATLSAAAGEKAETEESLREAILSGPDEPGVLMAQAYVSLLENRTGDAGKALNRYLQNNSDCAESSFYLSKLSLRAGRPDDARRFFEDSVLQNPLLVDNFLQEASTSMLIMMRTGTQEQRQFNVRAAEMYFSAVLEARPESAEALTGLSLVYSALNNREKAFSYAKAAVASSPSYAAGYYNLAAVYRAFAGSTPEGTARMMSAAKSAGELDKTRLLGKDAPDLKTALLYYMSYGQTPLLLPPS